jgi:hypothetical protein
MEFFVETGVYLLIVALAAGAAGFVALKVLGIGRMLKRSPARATRKEWLGTEQENEADEWDVPAFAKGAMAPQSGAAATPAEPAKAPLPAAQPPAPEPEAAKQAMPQEPVVEPVVTPTPPEAEVAATLPADTAENPNPGPAAEESAAPDAAVESQPADVNADAPADEGPAKTVAAPPDETPPGEDSFLAMFAGGEDDDSSVGELAEKLDDIDMMQLLLQAREVASSMESRGGTDA